MASTSISDVVVPSVFTPYVQQLTEDKSRIIQSGAVARDPMLDGLLGGGGLTFNVPGWRDVDNDVENISTDADNDAVPNNLGSDTEIGVRLSRNNGWGSYDLVSALAGEDPLDVIARRVANYWVRRLQAVLIALQSGINKDNGVADGGDYAHEIVGGAFVNGVTNFSAEAQIDAAQTMGDSSDDLAMIAVHSIVYARMKKNNLIDFIPDSNGVVNIPTYLGALVMIDDNMPSGTAVVRKDGTAGVAGMFESWMYGPGAIRLGVGTPKVPTEIDRKPQSGDGGGREELWNRVEWLMHMTGHAYIGTAASGGPSNLATANNLNINTSWNRVYQERKQIKFARLITRES